MAGPRTRIALGLWCGFVAMCAVFVALRFSTHTSITHFVESGADPQRAELVRRLAQSQLARTMVFTVAHSDLDAALAGARTLVAELEDDPEVAWISAGVDERFDQAIFATYFPRRFMFAALDPEAELPSQLSDEGLKKSAQELKRALMRPTGTLIKRLAPSDPWLFFVRHLERLRALQFGRLHVQAGQFVTPERSHAVVFVATEHAPMDSEAQGPLELHIEQVITRLAAEGATVERSSVHRIALASERSIRADVERISIVSMAAVVITFVVLFGSWRPLAIATLPLAVGIVVATAAILAVFGTIHGLTFAFGATLIGVCIDYPVHMLTQRALAAAAPAAVLAHVGRGLVLGAVTTVVGFVGLSFANFPGIREIGLFSAVGVSAALVTSLLVVTSLLRFVRPAPPLLTRARSMAASWMNYVTSRRGHGWALLVLFGACLAIGLPRIEWVDGAAALNRMQPGMLEEDERVRDRVARADLSRLVVASGASDEQALQRNEVVARALRANESEGQLRYRGVYPLLASVALQRENLSQFAGTEGLPERTLAALETEGFVAAGFPELYSAFEEQPKPLVPSELASTVLAPIVGPYRVELDGGIAYLTFVDQLADAGVLRDRLAGIDGVWYFDQHEFLEATYRAYRSRTIPVLALGLLGVFGVLWLRYRALRAAVAAFLPALIAATLAIAILALAGIALHLMHVLGLLLVLSIGVDYGVFLAEARLDGEQSATTVVGVAVACASTVLSFGLLAASSNPALAAVGITTAIGVILSFALAPTIYAILFPRSSRRDSARSGSDAPP